MDKATSKAFTVRSRLKNKFLKSMSEEIKRNYARQRNNCVKLLNKEKKNLFVNLDTKIIEDNINF